MLMLLKCIAGMTEWRHLPPARLVERGPGHRAHAAAYLHPGLGQVDLHGQLLPGKHVGVVSLGKDGLQSLQLDGHRTRRLHLKWVLGDVFARLRLRLFTFSGFVVP